MMFLLIFLLVLFIFGFKKACLVLLAYTSYLVIGISFCIGSGLGLYLMLGGHISDITHLITNCHIRW